MSFLKKIFGQRGEDYAVKILKQKGYKILDRNFKTKVGEIDIVASIGDCLVFIEVKARKNDMFGSPLDAVGVRKQQIIQKVSMEYLNMLNSSGVDTDKLNTRYDVVGLTGAAGSFKVEHVEGAF